MMKWLKFFRIVNLPTVPGDVLVGFAAAMAVVPRCVSPAAGNGSLYDAAPETGGGTVLCACLASCFLYLWGLADNDIVGAKTDTDRPIPNGEISLGAARVARALCLAAALACAVAGGLTTAWGCTAGVLLLAMIVYNRTQWSPVMGLCRGLNVLCGVMAVTVPRCVSPAALDGVGLLPAAFGCVASLGCSGETHRGTVALLCCFLPPLLWTLYIWFVTKLSEGEETDPMKKQLVGALIGGLVYLQLAALVVFAVIEPATNKLLIAGAVLLIVLRFTKHLLPKVSAS